MCVTTYVGVVLELETDTCGTPDTPSIVQFKVSVLHRAQPRINSSL